ncbi:class I SAM-dependent methyltransferase [Metabacillus herbersteinensis]|uniref:Uncharacterized methyltransferase ACFFIX_01280 n=1 Tax=Metabacillus herbersteinensis TaxID=283816 RepID=A0ABV6G8T2_9BACI
MGREFLDLFENWAHTYDTTVNGQDTEYKEVFVRYDQILEAVTNKSGLVVLEFGVGTGNLTQKLIVSGKKVYGIEPSAPMREKALNKLSADALLADGDFISFPKPLEDIDTIVSTYAFHHLTDNEKNQAISSYSNLLKKNGKIVFADTVFVDEFAHKQMIKKATQQNYFNLAKDLETEYYTTLSVLKTIFEDNGFTVTFTQMNDFVWLSEAVKK